MATLARTSPLRLGHATKRSRYFPIVDLDQKGNLCAPSALEHTSFIVFRVWMKGWNFFGFDPF